MKLCGIGFLWLLHANILHIFVEPKQWDNYVDNTTLSLRQCVIIHNMLVSYNEELLALAQYTLPLFLLSHGCLWMLQLLLLYIWPEDSP
jgi:uncharacterized membrane protein